MAADDCGPTSHGNPDVPTAALTDLMAQARRIRDDHFGRTLTYSPKVFIPLTRLCRDVCHYCTFAQVPNRVTSPFMALEDVLQVARDGEAAGCTEALLTLGEKPELRYRVARDWLHARGYQTTIDYVVAACKAIVEQTSLVPHVNAGNLTRSQLRRLRPVMGSVGLMLESGATALIASGYPHFDFPVKDPWR